MKTKSVIFSLALAFLSLVSSSQDLQKSSDFSLGKNQIGIQFNPYLNQNESFTEIAYGIRYGHKLSEPFMIGAELSGTFSNPLYDGFNLKYEDYRIGLFTRYSFFTEKRIQGFLEASPFYVFRHIAANETYNITETNKALFGFYAAPGISIFSKNRKFSFDLYYKFYIHPGEKLYYKENTISYKLNFHF
jgi:hypothetical protein